MWIEEVSHPLWLSSHRTLLAIEEKYPNRQIDHEIEKG